MSSNVIETIRSFSVTDYYRMAEAGIFNPDERTELVEGLILKMAPISHEHSHVQSRLLEQLYAFAHQRKFDVWLGGVEIDAGTEVYPDASLIEAGCGARRQPRPADVLVVFEVSQSSLGYDLGRKAMLYARSGIGEYVVLDVASKCAHAFSGPHAGGYGEHRKVETGRLTLQTLPLGLNVPALFGS
jgi:Uma2 family endonuclease